MSFESLKTELCRLSPEDRRKLLAFMVVLEDEGRASYASDLARKLDDHSPGRWLSVEECERSLGLSDGKP